MNPVVEFANSLPNEVKWCGSAEYTTHSINLHYGNLTCIFENGNLRYISSGKTEIIRMVFSAVRDKAWLTATPTLSNVKLNQCPDSFTIGYTGRYILNDIDFIAHYTIEGKNDNTLTFEMNGEALSSFYRNRIGFCVLHPIETLAGEPCTIVHSNGGEETLSFPWYISPHQPFKNIMAMKWKCPGNIQAELLFDGEVFETEDQRNWTDASFKTYCTPLDLSWPVLVTKGEKIHQKIELKINTPTPIVGEVNEEISVQLFTNELYKMPEIGVGQSSRNTQLNKDEVHILKKLPFDHYRVDVYLFDKQWGRKAALANNEAFQLGYPLEIVLFFDENAVTQVTDFCKWANIFKPNIARLIIFHKSIASTPASLLNAILPALKDAFPGLPIGGGTNANFAQLNRLRPNMQLLDFMSFAIHPQEHAFDNTSLVENLEAQKYTVQSAKQFAAGKEIYISPVNLMRRFNANIENYEHPTDYETIPPQVDTRLMSIFGAAWTLGSIKYLSECGISGATFYETIGERGLMQGKEPTKWPGEFASVTDMIFPVFHIFGFLLNRKKYRVIKSTSSSPLTLEVFALLHNHKVALVLVNFKPNKLVININGFTGEAAMYTMHAENFSRYVSNYRWHYTEPQIKISLQQPLILPPFSVNFIEQE